MLQFKQVSLILQSLKGVSIVWIVAFHLVIATQENAASLTFFSSLFELERKTIVEEMLRILAAVGLVGVNIFIFISGFGLTASWFKQQEKNGRSGVSLKTFWIKRVSKILPSFLLAIGLTTLIYCFRPAWIPSGNKIWQDGNFEIFQAFFLTITTIRNFVPAHEYYYFLNGAWWYIGLAFQLYFIFPALIKFGCKQGWNKLLLTSFLISLVYQALIVLSSLTGIQKIVLINLFPARLFDFSLGIYVAISLLLCIHSYKTKAPIIQNSLLTLLGCKKLLLFDGLLLSTGLLLRLLSMNQYELLEVPASFLCTIGSVRFFVNILQFKNPIQACIKFIGEYSYGIYLTHMSVYLAFWEIVGSVISSYWIRFFTVILLCCVFGVSFEIVFSNFKNIKKIAFKE